MDSNINQEDKNKNIQYVGDADNNVVNELTCQVIAQFSNLNNVSAAATKPCIATLNNFAKKVLIDTVYITRRGKRCLPSVNDVVSAMKLRKLNTSFSGNPAKIIPLKPSKQSGTGDMTLFYPEDQEVDLKEILSKDPNKVPYELSLTEHWLSIYAVQPATPENPTPAYIHAQKRVLRDKVSLANLAARNARQTGTGGSSLNQALAGPQRDINGVMKAVETSKSNAVRGNLNGIALGFNGDRMPALVIDVRPHFVGTEHQIYFKTLTEACVGNDENARNNALMTIKNDKALDPLLPHLMQFIAEGIRLNIINQNLAVLIYLVRIVRSLVDNPNVNLDPYLHRILPALLSVVLCGNICLNPITDNHFALRKFAGKVVNGICERQHTARNELVNRLCTVLISNIKQTITGPSYTDSGLKDGKPLTLQTSISNNSSGDFTMRLNTLCGSVLCLAELSMEAVRQCLVPRVSTVCQFMTLIIKSKGSTLPGSEDKAICQLKEALLAEKVVKALFEYRLSKGLELSQDACMRDFGAGMGNKYFDLFCKATTVRTSSLGLLHHHQTQQQAQPQQQHAVNTTSTVPHNSQQLPQPQAHLPL